MHAARGASRRNRNGRASEGKSKKQSNRPAMCARRNSFAGAHCVHNGAEAIRRTANRSTRLDLLQPTKPRLEIRNSSLHPSNRLLGRRELVSNLLTAGEPLAEVEREAEASLDFCRRAAFRDFIDWGRATKASINL